MADWLHDIFETRLLLPPSGLSEIASVLQIDSIVCLQIPRDLRASYRGDPPTDLFD
jgi:hypothetical protein